MTCPVQTLSNTTAVKALICRRLQAEGEASATPRIIRRFLETEMSLKSKSLDEHKKLINKLIKNVIVENFSADAEVPKPTRNGSKKSPSKTQKKRKRSRSPSRTKTTSPHYNLLRRLCFVVKINCNRLGIGGKSLKEKMSILCSALAEKGFDAEALNGANIEETLEMAEMKRDREELAEDMPELSGRRRKRSTENYTEFFESRPVSDASEASLDSDGDADDESDHVSEDSSSDFKADSDEESADSDDEYSAATSEEEEKKKKKVIRKPRATKSKSQTLKKTATKSKVLKKAKTAKKAENVSMDVDAVTTVLPKKRKRSQVSYVISDDESEEESHMRKRRSVISESDASEANAAPSDAGMSSDDDYFGAAAADGSE